MYTNSLSVLTLGEDQTPPTVNVELWQLWTTIDDEGIAADHQSLLGSTTISTGLNASFSIGSAAFQPISPADTDDLVLAVQTPGEPGHMFRSPRVKSLPNPGGASDRVDIWLTGPISLPQSKISSSLPTVPMRVDDSTTITGLTALITNDGIDLTAAGTTVIFPPTPVSDPITNTFTYRVSAAIEPASIHQPDVALVASPSSDPTVAFAGVGFTNSAVAAFLNLLNPFIATDVLPQIMERINTAVADAAISNAVDKLNEAGATLPANGGLPEGVFISVERVTTRPGEMTIWAALHRFGNLRETFFPNVATPSVNCVATFLAPFLSGLLLPGLYRFRDDTLINTLHGRELIEIYYRHAPALARLCATNSVLRSNAMEFLRGFHRLLGVRRGNKHRLFEFAVHRYRLNREDLPSALRRDLDAWLHKTTEGRSQRFSS